MWSDLVSDFSASCAQLAKNPSGLPWSPAKLLDLPVLTVLVLVQSRWYEHIAGMFVLYFSDHNTSCRSNQKTIMLNPRTFRRSWWCPWLTGSRCLWILILVMSCSCWWCFRFIKAGLSQNLKANSERPKSSNNKILTSLNHEGSEPLPAPLVACYFYN